MRLLAHDNSVKPSVALPLARTPDSPHFLAQGFAVFAQIALRTGWRWIGVRLSWVGGRDRS